MNLESTFEYDYNGNVIKSVSSGVTSTFTYDRLNRVTKKKFEGGEVGETVSLETSFEYDNHSNLTRITLSLAINKSSDKAK